MDQETLSFKVNKHSSQSSTKKSESAELDEHHRNVGIFLAFVPLLFKHSW